MAELRVNIEQGNEIFYAHATDFLGCFAKAPSRSEVIDALLKDVKNYSEWILSKEINNTYKIIAKEFQQGINEIEIIEEQTDIENLGEQNGSSAFFKSDTEELSDEMFNFYIQLVKYLTDDLARLVFHLSKEELNQEILIDKPTINQELTKIYHTELNFISIFGEEIEQKFLEAINLTRDELESLSILEKMLEVKQGAVAILRFYYPKIENKEFKNKKTNELPEETWTLKKIMRKLIELEREQLTRIQFLVNALTISKVEKKEIK
ncbi:MAG: hypothetical protein ACFFDW_07730 [Candidatus Thorarchaeota archaeon]